MTTSRQGKIITFYSYKGGTGRSMALANVAWILASNSKRVLVVDWDLEAPGLQRYFRPFLVDRELTNSPGVVDLITDFILAAITPLETGEKLAPDWFVPRTDIDPYVISLNWKFPSGGQLDFIPAGKQGSDYGQRFSSINWQKFYDVLGGGAFIEQLKINMRSQYDYILVDSRTGVSDTSGICTIQLPDTLVVCFTFNNQSIEGAASITQGVFDQRTVQDSHSSLATGENQEQFEHVPDRFYLSPYRFKVFPVPMRVDQGEKDKLGIRQAYSRRRFDHFLDRKTVLDRRAFWGAVAVPYVPYFSYEEILATFKDDPTDPNTCLAAFTRIATEITERDVTGFVPLIDPDQRNAVLQEFASVPMPETANAADDGKGVVQPGRAPFPVTPVFGDTAESELESSLRRAETTFRSLNEVEREQARMLWMRLVRIPRPGENIENSKVRVPLKDIDPASNPVIKKFQEARVLTVTKDDNTGLPTVEVKEEDLLRSWPTLDRWIAADRYLMIWRQDLQSTMAQWQERGRGLNDLLAGRRLWKARQWYKSHRQYLNHDEVEFIETSLKWFTRVAVAAAVVVVAMFVLVYYFQTSSDKSKMAETIAANAEAQIESAKRGGQQAADQLQLGLLLAAEAQQLAPTPKAEELLKANLERLPRRFPGIDVKNNVLALAFSPNGSQVLSVTGLSPLGPTQLIEDRTAQLNNVSNGQIILRLPFKPGSRSFRLSPDARYLAVVSRVQTNDQVDVLEVATGKLVTTIEHRDAVYDMAFSPDGSYFATASGDRRARVVNLRAPGRVPLLDPQYTGAVNAVSFSGDSRHLAISGEDFMVHVLRNIPSAGASDARHIRVGSTAFQIALSNDGRYLATVTLDNKFVSLWDVENESRIKISQTDGGTVYPIWFTPDNRYLMAAAGGTVYAWSVSPETAVRRIQYDTDNLVNYSNDGKYFAAYGNSLARIWEYDGSAFSETAVLIHKSNLLGLIFGNPNFVVTAGADNLVIVWKLGEPLSDNLRAEACLRLNRNMTLDEWNNNVASYLGNYKQTCPDIR